MKSFDVVSTEQNGVEVVILPIHAGSVMLQFKGKAIYIDPEGVGDYSGLPLADYVFLTEPPAPRTDGIRKEATVVVPAGSMSAGEKKSFGEIEAEAVGKGYVFGMAGRHFYVSGDSLSDMDRPPLQHLDVAFVCAANVSSAVAFIQALRPRVVYPYRYGARTDAGPIVSALKSDRDVDVRLRNWY